MSDFIKRRKRDLKVKCIQRFSPKPWEIVEGNEYQVTKSYNTPQGKVYSVIAESGNKMDVHERYFSVI